MPLRVMQIILPEPLGESTDELLAGRQILGSWQDSNNAHTVLHLLVPAEETEPIMDQFEQRFRSRDGFYVVLFPVEAVLPRPKEEVEQPDTSLAAQATDEAEDSIAEENAVGPLRISREELYAEVNEGIDLSWVFISMTILSAVVAAVGLMRDDVAVIIGAMVIAPLLGPNVAMSLGTTLGDIDLLRRALLTNIAGVVTALLLSVIVGMLFEVNPQIAEIHSRTQVSVGDILLALSAGTAGTLAFTRGLAGAVIGVMVAVALVPPLVAAGILLGSGYLQLSLGAFLLTAANVICINLAGIVTFVLQGVRPRTWWEAKRAKWATRKAVVAWFGLLLLLLLILWLDEIGLGL